MCLYLNLNPNPNPKPTTMINEPAITAVAAAASSESNAAAASTSATSSPSLPANSPASLSKLSALHLSLASANSPILFPHLPPLNQQHQLKSAFSFWYLNKKKVLPSNPNANTNNAAVTTTPPVAASADASHSYEENIKKMATFHTIEEFWCIYSHLTRPNSLPQNSQLNLHLFRTGVAPIWEECILALIGDSFHLGEEICGIVLVTKNTEDVLSIWNATANNKEYTNRIKETMKRILDLPNNAPLEYRPHDVALKNATGR